MQLRNPSPALVVWKVQQVDLSDPQWWPTVVAGRNIMVKSSDFGAQDNMAPSPIKILPTMTKTTRNSGEPWGREEVKELRVLAKQKMSTRLIGIRLCRSEASIRSKFFREGIPGLPRQNGDPG